MIIIRENDAIPNKINKSIFLSMDLDTFKKSLEILKVLNYNGIIFYSDNYNDWAENVIRMSDIVLTHFNNTLPINLYKSMYNLIGELKQSEKLIITKEPDYEIDGLDLYNGLLKCVELPDTIRLDGERYIPYYIFNDIKFQSWYKSHKKVGNWISSADVNFKDNFSFVLWVNMFIKSENRFKNNEYIISRPDLSSCVLYYPNEDIKKSKIVLVKEFRTSVNNDESMVYELPGGSGNTNDMEKTVIDEVYEEIGFKVDKDKLEYVNNRQIFATMLTVKNHIYKYELSETELNIIEYNSNTVFGNHSESEYTTIEILTIEDILNNNLCDYQTLGIIFETI